MSQKRIVAYAAAALLVGVGAVGMLRPTQAADPISSLQPQIVRDLPPTPVAGPAPESPVFQSAGSQILAQDRFSSEATPAWQAVDLTNVPSGEEPATWKVREGRLQQYGTGELGSARVGPTAAVTGDASWKDYTTTASFYSEDGMDAGLIARRDGTSYYRFRVINNVYEDPQKILLEKVVNGEATVLAASEGPGFDTYTWYTLSLKVNGTTIEGRIGNTVLTAQDGTLTSGQAGVYGQAIGGLGFDNVSVVAP